MSTMKESNSTVATCMFTRKSDMRSKLSGDNILVDYSQTPTSAFNIYSLCLFIINTNKLFVSTSSVESRYCSCCDSPDTKM